MPYQLLNTEGTSNHSLSKAAVPGTLSHRSLHLSGSSADQHNLFHTKTSKC